MQQTIFDTLADPTRRQIIEVLGQGEKPVNDIVGKLNIHQSGVSRHLRILAESGFVQMRPAGQRRLYSLRADPFRDMDAWLNQFRRLWETRLYRFGQALEAKQSAHKPNSRSKTRRPK